jgi:hypothetical protein
LIVLTIGAGLVFEIVYHAGACKTGHFPSIWAPAGSVPVLHAAAEQPD